MRVVNSHSVPTFKSWEVFQQLVPRTQFVLHSESVDVRYAASLSACAGRDAAVWLDCCWFESLPRRVWACWMPSPLVSMKCPRARRSNGSQSLHCRRQKTALLKFMIKVRFFFLSLSSDVCCCCCCGSTVKCRSKSCPAVSLWTAIS